jgi:hypothetical protein
MKSVDARREREVAAPDREYRHDPPAPPGGTGARQPVLARVLGLRHLSFPTPTVNPRRLLPRDRRRSPSSQHDLLDADGPPRRKLVRVAVGVAAYIHVALLKAERREPAQNLDLDAAKKGAKERAREPSEAVLADLRQTGTTSETSGVRAGERGVGLSSGEGDGSEIDRKTDPS